MITRIIYYFLAGSTAFFSGLDIPAQNVRISGKISDATTGEALPAVSVFLQGTTIGTTTDFNGNYLLETSHLSDSLSASFIGYKTQNRALSTSEKQIIDFKLQQDVVNFEEVIIIGDKKEKNPALIFMKKVVEHKSRNDPRQLDFYQYEIYSKMELDLNNIEEEFKNKKMMRQFGFMFEQHQAADSTSKPYLPVILSENISDVYYRKRPKIEKEVIKASQISGIKNESIKEQLANTHLSIHLYDNYINIFDKGFISPLASNGWLFYRYYITDSLEIQDEYCYQITFIPRREEDLVFSGKLWISTGSYALVKAALELSPRANINWVNNLILTQEFEQVDTIYMLQREFLLMDASLSRKKDKVGIYARKKATYRNIQINQPQQDDFYSSEIVMEDNAGERDAEFWEYSRHDSLSEQEQLIYENVKKLQKIPFFMSLRDLASTILNGYQKVGMFELGPYMKLVTYNPVEGLRVRLGLRTNGGFSRKWRLETHGAYGFYDQHLKYGGGIMYLFSKDPRQAAGIRFKYDMEQIGLSETAYDVDHILGSLLSRRPLDRLSLVRETESYYEKEWKKGVSNTFSLVQRQVFPHQFDDFSAFGGHINSMFARFSARIAPGEKVIIGDFDRTIIHSKQPVFHLAYDFGFKEPGLGDFEFHQLTVDFKHQLGLGPLGYSKYFLSAGKIWGNMPYVMLYVLAGNENFTLDHMSYNLMNYYEFVTDEYISIYYTHYFDGLIADKIPFIKKFQIRELVWGKAIAGRLRNEHSEVHPYPDFLDDLNAPYYEAGFGVENILKVLRFDALWRLSHLDKPNVSPFGVRGSLQVKF